MSYDVLKKYAKGNKDAPLKVISLGLGVQSTAVYLMSSMGYKLPRADFSIFADPGAEHEKTYKMLDWLKDWQKKNNGIEIIVDNDRNILTDILNAVNRPGGSRWASIPAHSESGGIIRRQCTYEYKIMPVVQQARKLHGIKKFKRMKPTEMWLGISTDEIERMKESRLYNIKYFYPLIYHNLSRYDCINFFKEHDFPVPMKSSCVFCPFHSNKNWKELKKENGEAWKTSVKVDNIIRDKSQKGLKDKIYLHSSCKPLEEIDFEDNQLEMFEGFDCEGHCGL